MTLEPSMNNKGSEDGWNWQNNKLGEFYGEFLGEQSRSNQSSDDETNKPNTSDGGVLFGQKALLKGASTLTPLISPEKTKRPWSFSSVPTFSDLAQDVEPVPRTSTSTFLSATTNTTSFSSTSINRASDIETDSASPRVLLNSASTEKIVRKRTSDHLQNGKGLFQLSEKSTEKSIFDVNRATKNTNSFLTPARLSTKTNGSSSIEVHSSKQNSANASNGLNRMHFNSTPLSSSTPSFTVSPVPLSKSKNQATVSSSTHAKPSSPPTFMQTHKRKKFSHPPHHRSPPPTLPQPHSLSSPHQPAISYYDLVDTEVKFFDPSDNRTRVGIVSKVSTDKIATIHKYPSGFSIKIPCSELRAVPPQPPDKVKVISSSGKILGKVGNLLTVIGDCGVVQFVSYNGDIGRNLAQVKLANLAKYVKSPKAIPSLDKRVSSTESSDHSSSSNWSSNAAKPGVNFPLAPFPVPLMATSFMVQSPGSYPLYNGAPMMLSSSTSSQSTSAAPSDVISTGSNFQFGSSSNPYLEPVRPVSNSGPASFKSPKSLFGMPLSYQICPSSTGSSNTNPFLQESLFQTKPISRGGGGALLSREQSSVSDDAPRRRSINSHRDVADILDRLLARQREYRMNDQDDDSVDVKTSCVRVSLVCPISQKRMTYPSRGYHCKHLQCFDAEAYIMMNLHHKAKGRVKQANGQSFIQPLPNKKWHCPICFRYVHENQLYIDKSLMSVINEYQDSVGEVELNATGTWQPIKKVVDMSDVIDLTADDDG